MVVLLVKHRDLAHYKIEYGRQDRVDYETADKIAAVHHDIEHAADREYTGRESRNLSIVRMERRSEPVPE